MAGVKRAPRIMPPKRGYRPAGEPEGYTPARRTRKAPKAYWRRNPFPDGYGVTPTGAPHPLPRTDRVEWDDLQWDDDWPDDWP